MPKATANPHHQSSTLSLLLRLCHSLLWVPTAPGAHFLMVLTILVLFADLLFLSVSQALRQGPAPTVDAQVALLDEGVNKS